MKWLFEDDGLNAVGLVFWIMMAVVLVYGLVVIWSWWRFLKRK